MNPDIQKGQTEMKIPEILRKCDYCNELSGCIHVREGLKPPAGLKCFSLHEKIMSALGDIRFDQRDHPVTAEELSEKIISKFRNMEYFVVVQDGEDASNGIEELHMQRIKADIIKIMYEYTNYNHPAIQQAIDEREALVKAFAEITGVFEGRSWIIEGRGAYPYDDDRYKEEVRKMMDEFNAIKTDLWRQFRSKTYEYKQSIEKPLLDKIKELESRSEPLNDEVLFQMAEYLQGWMTSQKYGEESLLHAAVCCDWVGRIHFIKALRDKIKEWMFNQNKGGIK